MTALKRSHLTVTAGLIAITVLIVPAAHGDTITSPLRTFGARDAGHTSTIISVAFSRDGTRVLTGSHDKTAKLWDAATGEQIRTFSGHTHWVNSVAFSPDGTQVLTGSTDQTAKLWDIGGL